MPFALRRQGDVDHHDRVLLHDADQHQQADDRDEAQVHAEQPQRQQRADDGRRQAGQDRERVNVALVEDAQHDVDRHDRRHQQDALVGQRVLEGLGVAGRSRWSSVAGNFCSAFDLVDARHRIAERNAGRQIERERHGRKLPELIDGQRAGRALDPREGADRHELAARCCGCGRPAARPWSSWPCRSNSITTAKLSPVP